MRTVACLLMCAAFLAGCSDEPDPSEPLAPLATPQPLDEVAPGEATEDRSLEEDEHDDLAIASHTAGDRTKKQEDEEKAAARRAPSKSSEDTGLGVEGGATISARQVKQIVTRNMGQMRACYERELKKNASLRGKVVLSWTIGADGVVRRPSVVKNTTRSRALTPCMTRSLKRWRFPKAKSPFDVEYPFTFKPKDW